MSLLLRAGLALAVVAILAAIVVLARLQQGPLALPGIAHIVVERLNADSPGNRLSVGNVVLSLGDASTPSGLQFLDVRVRTDDGALLFEAPAIAASFLARDVVLGRIKPIRISLLNPALEVVRDTDGKFRVGMASAVPAEASQDPTGQASEERFDMVSDALDSLVGDASAFPQLERLTEVRVVGADLTYMDQIAGRSWRTQDANVLMSKHDRGVRAVLTLDDIAGDKDGLSLRLLADRLKGTGETLLTFQFGRVAAKALSEQAPGLEWLALMDGQIEGRASARLERQGSIRDLQGVIVAEDGALLLGEDSFPYEFAKLAFAVDPSGEAVEIQEFTATSQQLGVRMNALAELDFNDLGEFNGISLDAEMDRFSLSLPEVFDGDLNFDAIGVTARWDRETNEIEIASADMRAMDTTYVLAGRLIGTGTDWLGDMRLTASDTSIRKVLDIWPIAAAKNARDWIDQNIRRATIPELLVNLRFGTGTPSLAMDFAFSDLEATYLAGMSPLKSVSGNAHVGYDGLELRIDDGYVTTNEADRIALGGSRVTITGFWADVTDADIKVLGRGDVESVLRLIDQQPLGLVRKLGVDLGPVAGSADLDVDVRFPLENDLLLEDIYVSAAATLSKLGLVYDVPVIGNVRIDADAARLRADTKEMSLAGDVRLDGTRSRVVWQEYYGAGRSGRTLKLETTANDNLLERLSVPPSIVSGNVPFELVLEETVGQPLRLDIDADLRDATMSLAELGWSKEPGARASLKLALLPGDETVVDRFGLDAPGLRADGRIVIDGAGGFRSARLERLDLADVLDLSAVIERTEPNAYSVTIDGNRLDVKSLLERQGDGSGQTSAGPKIDATFRLKRLIVSEDIRLTQASGRYMRNSNGSTEIALDGKLAGRADVSVRLDRNAEDAGTINVTGNDAGEILSAMGLYDDANGGKLTLNADINKETELNGVIRIEDLQIGDGSSVRQVLRGAGLEGAETVIENTGLSFRKIWIPFATSDGQIVLSDAIASGSALAVKVNGSVEQESGQLNLRGVISPAYGLTGALDNVPLLGTLLSGGEGEGILAMTFTLKGASKDPDFSVNPLSLLTPGFLRNVFEGESSGSSEDFRKKIQRQDR